MHNFLLSMSQLLGAAEAATKATEILNGIAGPVLIALGGAAAIYMIVLGVQFAKSEDDGKRNEIKKRLVNTAIGVVVIIALGTLCTAIKWDSIVEQLFGYAWSDQVPNSVIKGLI